MPLNQVNSRPFIVLASIAIVLYLLFWLQPVLVPLALAILLTFLLSPVVAFLQRHGLRRVPAVIAAATVALLVISSIGWLVGRQLNALVDGFPQYEENLRRRITALREGEAGFFEKLQRAVKRTTREIEKQMEKQTPAADVEPDEKAALPVRVIGDGTSQRFGDPWAAMTPVLAPLAAVGLAVVLVIFMLIRREDLRDRLISLVGHGRVTVTTKALDEASERISRYLLMQLIVNGTFGLAVGIGLYFIGIPHAALWGFLAAVLRYIPYIGPWIAASLPFTMTILVSETWTPPLLVIALFLVAELLSNLVMEPWLYGRRIGISETALLVMIAFWTWLWGPIGLVLATPLTVCLALLGKYVPLLSFFDTLLSDGPALDVRIGYYQRLLARDQDEASDIAQAYMQRSSLEKTCDGLLIPALIHARRDFERDELNDQDLHFVLEATREIFEELIAMRAAAPDAPTAEKSATAAAQAAGAKFVVLGCPARDESDELALVMLEHVLGPSRCKVEVTSAALLTAELSALVGEHVEQHGRPLICIASLPPGGVTHTRLLCRRLRASYPDLKILVGRWSMEGSEDETRAQLLAAGADLFAASLEETGTQVLSLASLSDRPADPLSRPASSAGSARQTA
ncbi:MAG TPA: AI-2E family transporter [Burkholderiaceae bacterium]|nr:AI-2E family transporter [Burkholderiaceae bacterium]